MVWLDARIPLRFGLEDALRPAEMLLHEADLVGPTGAAHDLRCTCCTPRSRAAEALSALFRRRVLSPGPMATSVLAVVGPAAEAALREAVNSDPVASSRFRLG